jgi:hypothetical protein
MRVPGGQGRVRRLDPRVTDRDRTILGAAADARQRRAAVTNRRRQPSTRPRADRDQQFVVVGLERCLDRIEALGFEERPRRRIDRQQARVNRHTDAARLGNASDAVSQTVTQIDAGRGGTVPTEQEPETNSWRGCEIGSHQSPVVSRQS